MSTSTEETTLDLERVKAAEEFRPFETKLFNILHDLIQPGNKLEPTAAAAQINDLFPSNGEDSSKAAVSPEEQDDAATEPEAFLWALWGLIIQVMRLVPPRHPGQDRMISLLQSLRELPARSLEIWGSEQQLWSDFPILRPCLRDHLDYIGQADPDGISEWINQNSFMARLVGKGLLSWDTLIVWMMRDVLEDDLPQEEMVQDCYISVASEWITHAGTTIYNQLSSQEMTEQQKRVMKGGKLYEGPAGLRVERWGFWKSRLAETSQQASGKVRPAARAAADRMAEIEEQARVEKEMRG
ncbi:Uncharacterized protein PECH_007199 [Penicillium ucsense]|uniref:Uncharacterized protein n=1 Tax=Penicillium ucsense TaxID=2839758 RepID=A0A8J8VZG5_9EURO|nr:Uncharacterized protein PECM_008015 [Penicillium ucsense]KAF7735033.1 Uncharacterized protein PECH_007199 [Penicillium ucsense]